MSPPTDDMIQKPKYQKSNPGRLPIPRYEKWLTGMKAVAWYSYVVESGIDYKNIEIKYLPKEHERDGLPPLTYKKRKGVTH